MKKYFKLVLFVIIIVLAIGTFYISSTFTASGQPVYSFEKKSGDEKEIQSVVLFGDYYEGNYNSHVRLTADEVTYLNGESIWRQMTGAQLNPQIKKLQKEYWNFTRGKVTSPVNYFSNEKYIAYSNLASDYSFTNTDTKFMFHISVLNKETNKTTSFDMKVPNANEFSYISTASVQMVGDELKVITRNSTGDYDNIGFYLYTFDIANKKLKSGEVLLANPNNSANDIDYYLLSENEINHQSDYALFYQATTTDADSSDVEEIKLHNYNFTTGELTTEELPEILYGADYPSLYDGSHIYFAKSDGQNSEIISYNVDRNEIEDMIEFDIPLNLVSVNDGKLYVLGIAGESDRLMVVDLKSGNSLYEGDVVSKQDNKNELDMNSLHFYSIGFK